MSAPNSTPTPVYSAAYAALYAPVPAAAPAPAPTNRALVVAAALLWGITCSALSLIAFFVLMIAVWSASSGADVTALLLWPVVVLAGAGGLLTLLYFAPGVRRLSREARFTLLGALACPAPIALALYVMSA
ncbi:hypothetical protein ACFV9E_33945 [Streptomyces sp. NPDC059835]|uniref:hypothetical protein n=1 Tax=Streptomyces sp. NPDC059835 TaxID=3346967 RepID=UPI00364F0EBC